MSVFHMRKYYEGVQFDRNGVEITVPDERWNIKKRIWETEVQIEIWEKPWPEGDDRSELYVTGKFGLSSRLREDKKIQIIVTDPIVEKGYQKRLVITEQDNQVLRYISILALLEKLLIQEQNFVKEQLGNKFV